MGSSPLKILLIFNSGLYLNTRDILADVSMATGSSPSLSLSSLETLSSAVKLVGVACSVANLSFQPSRSTERERKKERKRVNPAKF